MLLDFALPDHDRKLIPEGRVSGPMPWVIAIMLFLTLLVAAAGLALVVDALLGLAELGIARRRRGLVAASLGLLLLGVLAALAPAWPAGKATVTIGRREVHVVSVHLKSKLLTFPQDRCATSDEDERAR